MEELKSLLEIYTEEHPAQSLSTAVYYVLLQRIISFDMLPDSQLIVSTLAQDMGVSMTPVREALQKLSENGLVVIEKGKKARVSNFNWDDYNNLHYFRCAIDSLAAEQVAILHNMDDIAVLRRICDDMKVAYARLDEDPDAITELARLDMEFHREMVRASHVPNLIELHEQIIPRATFFRQFFHPKMTEPYKFPDLHSNIVYTFKHCDPRSVVDTVRFHYRAGSHIKLFSEL